MNLFLRYGFKDKTALVVLEIINALLLLLLLYTGISKLADYATFLFVLKKSPLLYQYAGFIAIALPVTELVVALLLFLPATRLQGLYASLILVSLFTIYLSFMILFSTDLPCNCGGVVGSLSWKQHVPFNLFFIAIALYGIQLNKKLNNRKSSPPP